MPGFEQLRDRTLDTLARHFAVGNLRAGTLEHRLEAALAASAPHELDEVTWDLPALGRSLRERLGFGARRRPCSRIAFKVAPETTLPIGGGPTTWVLGRSRTCDVVLHDPAISRRHALLSTRGGQCSIRDLGSTNGVEVNGEPVQVAVLHAGDVVTLGGVAHAVVR